MAQGGVKQTVTTIVWADAAGGTRQGWRPVHTAIKDSGTVHCIAAGCIIKETRRTVTVAPHCTFEHGRIGQVDGEISIPKGWIVSRRDVEVVVPPNDGEGDG